MAHIEGRPGAEVVQCISFDNDTVTYRSAERGDQGVVQDADFEIVREFPDTGVVNYGNDCLVISRKPMRQWRRGLHKEVLTEFSFFPDRASLLNNSTAMARTLFHPWYPDDVKDALELMDSHRSVALDRRFWLFRSEDGIGLAYKKIPIAVLRNGKFDFFEECTTLRQEALDFFGADYV
jgi:hypothetical protein